MRPKGGISTADSHTIIQKSTSVNPCKDFIPPTRRRQSRVIFRQSSRVAVCFLALLLVTACRENRQATSERVQHNAAFEGEWIATGPQTIGGYRAGDYTLSLRLLAEGKCTATVAYNYRYVTMLCDDPYSNVIYLSGKWERTGGLLLTNLSVDAWNSIYPPLEKGSAPKERIGKPSHDNIEKYPIDWEWKADGNQLSNTALVAVAIYRLDPKSTSGITNPPISLSKLVAVRADSSLPASAPGATLPHRDESPKTGEEKSRVDDPVGEWSNQGHHPELSLCLWESGEAAGEFQGPDLSIQFDGKWTTVPDGRWKGHVTLDATVTYWGMGQVDATPKNEGFSFMFDPSGGQLRYVRGEPLADRNGRLFHPSGEAANDDPVLRRLNSNRPIRREPGNK